MMRAYYLIMLALLFFVNAQLFIGKPAPLFSKKALVNGEFQTISLKDFKGKYVVLVFYPLDNTFVCPTELIAFSDRINDFKALNTEVLAVSVDSEFSHLAWTKLERNQGGLGKMNIPLLSDLTKSMSREYNVLIEDEGISLRGLFIIDSRGILRQITVNDLPVGRNVDEVLRLVKAFQYSDSHNGEGCPANWNPNSKTIKTDPKASLEFFKAQYSEKRDDL